MSDDDIVAAITRAWRSLDPADFECMAREALRIARQGGAAKHVGYLNPRTGVLHRLKMDLDVGTGWVPVYADIE